MLEKQVLFLSADEISKLVQKLGLPEPNIILYKGFAGLDFDKDYDLAEEYKENGNLCSSKILTKALGREVEDLLANCDDQNFPNKADVMLILK